MSALHRAPGQALDVESLEGQVQDQGGKAADQGGGGEHGPLDDELAHRECDPQRHGALGVNGDEAKRPEEVLPRQQEREKNRGDGARHGDGRDDAEENLEARGAVHERRLVQLARNGVEIALGHPGGEGQADGHVGDDEAGEVVARLDRRQDLAELPAPA
jgi:hypothetical protein